MTLRFDPASPDGGGGSGSKNRARRNKQARVDRALDKLKGGISGPVGSDPFSPDPKATKKNYPTGPSERARAAQDRASRTSNQEKLQARLEEQRNKKAQDKREGNKDNNRRKGPIRSNDNPAGNYQGAAGAKVGAGRGRNGGRGRGNGSGRGSGRGQTGSTTTATPIDYKTRARSAVDLMLNPKINVLLREQDNIESEYTQQKNQLNTDTARQLSDLATTYQQLDNTLSGLDTNTQTAYNDATSKQSSAFDSLLATLGQNAIASETGAQSELQRLGLGSDVSGVQADNDYFQNVAATNKALAASQLAAMQANAAQYGNARRSNYQAAGAQSQAVAKQSATEMLNELLSERNSGIRQLGRQIADTNGQRGSLMNQLMEQYEQQAYERMMEDRQMQFANQMGVNEFNLKSDQFNADQAYRQAQLALAGQELELSAQKSAQQEQDDIENGGYGTGLPGAQGWVNKNVESGRRRAALNAILQRINTHRQRGDGFHDFNQNSYADFGKIMNYGLSFLNDPGYRFMNGPNGKNALKQALEAYFGKLD